MGKRLIKDTGLKIGTQLSTTIRIDSMHEEIQLIHNHKDTVLWFISMFCPVCLELIPHIKSMYDGNRQFVVFLDGDSLDCMEIKTYFKWDFPLISLNSYEMEEKFEVIYHPFAIVLDSNGIVIKKGEISNSSHFKKVVEE